MKTDLQDFHSKLGRTLESSENGARPDAHFWIADAFQRFARSVKQSGRYFRDAEATGFLDALLKEADELTELVPGGSHLWRAQLGLDLEEHYASEEDHWAEPRPLPPRRMKPLPDRAREGRANPKGITCLYLSTERENSDG
jgi:hypothetical protein